MLTISSADPAGEVLESRLARLPSDGRHRLMGGERQMTQQGAFLRAGAATKLQIFLGEE